MDRSQGVGMYCTSPVSVPLPPMLTHDDHFADKKEVEDILDQYRDRPPWDRRIACYELSLEGLKQTEIASRMGVRQGWVSESIRKVRELIERK
ncbi:hypothetical protein [Methanomethylophilus alvi]|jgi:DNA-directed RNA polymerase specialized sigma24 family protein|uniref:hypothetical protein n=2 Tax=Methanomethylophilus alvi TaxID=1291540 RepID=UPI0037DDD366